MFLPDPCVWEEEMAALESGNLESLIQAEAQGAKTVKSDMCLWRKNPRLQTGSLSDLLLVLFSICPS